MAAQAADGRVGLAGACAGERDAHPAHRRRRAHRLAAPALGGAHGLAALALGVGGRGAHLVHAAAADVTSAVERLAEALLARMPKLAQPGRERTQPLPKSVRCLAAVAAAAASAAAVTVAALDEALVLRRSRAVAVARVLVGEAVAAGAPAW